MRRYGSGIRRSLSAGCSPKPAQSSAVAEKVYEMVSAAVRSGPPVQTNNNTAADATNTDDDPSPAATTGSSTNSSPLKRSLSGFTSRTPPGGRRSSSRVLFEHLVSTPDPYGASGGDGKSEDDDDEDAMYSTAHGGGAGQMGVRSVSSAKASGMQRMSSTQTVADSFDFDAIADAAGSGTAVSDDELDDTQQDTPAATQPLRSYKRGRQRIVKRQASSVQQPRNSKRVKTKTKVPLRVSTSTVSTKTLVVDSPAGGASSHTPSGTPGGLTSSSSSSSSSSSMFSAAPEFHVQDSRSEDRARLEQLQYLVEGLGADQSPSVRCSSSYGLAQLFRHSSVFLLLRSSGGFGQVFDAFADLAPADDAKAKSTPVAAAAQSLWVAVLSLVMLALKDPTNASFLPQSCHRVLLYIARQPLTTSSLDASGDAPLVSSAPRRGRRRTKKLKRRTSSISPTTPSSFLALVSAAQQDSKGAVAEDTPPAVLAAKTLAVATENADFAERAGKRALGILCEVVASDWMIYAHGSLLKANASQGQRQKVPAKELAWRSQRLVHTLQALSQLLQLGLQWQLHLLKLKTGDGLSIIALIVNGITQCCGHFQQLQHSTSASTVSSSAQEASSSPGVVEVLAALLRILVNVTHRNTPACDAVNTHLGVDGLLAVLALARRQRDTASGRGDDTDLWTDATVSCLGLLVNCVEQSKRTRQLLVKSDVPKELALVDCQATPALAFFVQYFNCCTLQLPQHRPSNQSGGGDCVEALDVAMVGPGQLSVSDQAMLEAQFQAAYTAVLLGYMLVHLPTLQPVLRRFLVGGSFEALCSVLQELVVVQSQSNSLTADTLNALLSVVAVLKNYEEDHAKAQAKMAKASAPDQQASAAGTHVDLVKAVAVMRTNALR